MSKTQFSFKATCSEFPEESYEDVITRTATPVDVALDIAESFIALYVYDLEDGDTRADLFEIFVVQRDGKFVVQFLDKMTLQLNHEVVVELEKVQS
jgi:hypothetical protein